MKSLLQFVKNIKLKNILTVLLASSLIVLNTACSKGNNDVARVKDSAIPETVEKVGSNTYDQYDAKQQYKGGMNGYNDDRRYDTETAAKAKELVDTAKSRQTDNLGEYVEGVGDRASDQIKEAKRDIPRTLEANKKNAVDYVQDKSSNLKRNVSKVPGGAKDVFDGAVDTAQDAIDDANKATKSTSKDIKGNFKDLT